MAFTDYLTIDGKELLSKGIAGAQITFTKIVLGTGTMSSGDTEAGMRDVITPVIEVPIQTVKKSGDDMVVITALFSSTDIAESFYFREKGIYASDGTNEVLVIYGNAGADAELIDAASSSEIIQKKIRVALKVTSAESASITLTTGGLVDDTDFDNLREEMSADIEKIKTDLTEVINTKASSTTYGRAILSDTYDRKLSEGSADAGMGASQNALYNVYSKLKSTFQDGVDAIYNKIVSEGTTPASKKLTDVVAGIVALSANRFNDAKKGTAEAADVLKGKTFTNASDVEIEGTMPNNSKVSKTLYANTTAQTYTIPQGYHPSGGTVKVAKMTIAVPEADAILEGNSVNVNNGTSVLRSVVGTMANNGDVTFADASSGTVEKPAGYYNSLKVDYANAYAAGRNSKGYEVKAFSISAGPYNAGGGSTTVTWSKVPVAVYAQTTSTHWSSECDHQSGGGGTSVSTSGKVSTITWSGGHGEDHKSSVSCQGYAIAVYE